MQEKRFETRCGAIHYRVNRFVPGRRALVFLPGLTADHRLFEKQIEAFDKDYNLLVWDDPGHGASRPFELDFTLMDKAEWLHDILEAEGLHRPVLVGQSMGGYVAQCFIERYPGAAQGFVSIDSAPLKRRYVSAAELWLMKRCGKLYEVIPWKLLLFSGSRGCAASAYGRELMRRMMNCYTRREYARLSDHGMRMLAGAMEAGLAYKIDCPCLLICGEKDSAGSAKRYNRRWAGEEGKRLVMIPGAGHISNADAPEQVNALIAELSSEE